MHLPRPPNSQSRPHLSSIWEPTHLHSPGGTSADHSHPSAHTFFLLPANTDDDYCWAPQVLGHAGPSPHQEYSTEADLQLKGELPTWTRSLRCLIVMEGRSTPFRLLPNNLPFQTAAVIVVWKLVVGFSHDAFRVQTKRHSSVDQYHQWMHKWGPYLAIFSTPIIPAHIRPLQLHCFLNVQRVFKKQKSYFYVKVKMFGSHDWTEIDSTQVWVQKGRKLISIPTNTHPSKKRLWMSTAIFNYSSVII